MTLVYKATNIMSDKAYIGVTDKTLDARRYKHFIDANNGSSTHFHRALRKHSESNWEWEVLAECVDKLAGFDEEIKLIAEHNTFNNGYNSTTGGEGIVNHVHSEDSKRKISESLKGHATSDEVKQKISESMRGKVSGFAGKTHTAEVREKIAAAHTGRKRPHSAETKAKLSLAAKKRWARA